MQGSAAIVCRATARVRQWFALVLLSLIHSNCPGASPFQPSQADPLLEPWRWRTYLDLSGLDAQCIGEGMDGTMWFGTANGLWSYNGIEWTRHSGNENLGRIVTTVCSHPDGSLYAAGEWGISRLSNGVWTRLLSIAGDRISDLRDVPIRKLTVASDGEVWAATAWGVLRHRSWTWTLYTDRETASRLQTERRLPFVNVEVFPESVSSRLRAAASVPGPSDSYEMCADGLGRIWVGTTYGDVLCASPAPSGPAGVSAARAWSIFNEADGLSPGAVTSLLPAQDGTLWVVHAASEHADLFDGRGWRRVRLPLFLPALDLADVGGRLLQTRDGVMWLAARYKFFAYRGGHWRTYEQPEISHPGTRNVFMQSADGAFWFSGPNTEVYRIDYQTPRWLTLHDLNFQWESEEGTQWFLHRDGRIVVQEDGRWTSYGTEDGLMDMPVALLGTRGGDVWAAGSHGGTAAMARFDGGGWTLHLHDNFSFGIDWRAVFESSDGSVWFGAFVDTDGPEKHRNGLLQFRGERWIHHQQPQGTLSPDDVENPATILPRSTDPDHPIEKFICLGESRDGRLWAGRNILAFHDGRQWERFDLTPDMRRNLEAMLTTRDGDLWLGTRESGALHYDGREWLQYQGKDSLFANSVRSLAQTSDGSIWAATDRGASRFDGRAWMSDVLPKELYIAHESGSLKASPSGALWINRYTLYWMRRAWSKSPPPAANAEFHTVRFQFQGPPPRTRITTTAEVIAQPGNLAVLWSGVVPWRDPKDARLQFSFRLDDQPWSPFTSDRGHSFFTLPVGPHHLEVRARDADFNVDPTPATLDFEVLPPVWRQTWFLTLVFALGGLVVAQTIRVLREQARLRLAHDELEVRVRQRTAELESANRALQGANRELEAFSYSVSHDLRAPLRSIDGFSRILQQGSAHKLNDEEKENLQMVRASAQRMGQLIEDMLRLARIARSEMRGSEVNLSEIAGQIAEDLRRADPARQVDFAITPDCVAWGDSALLRIALENLLGNAWKYTSKKAVAKIEFGTNNTANGSVFFVRDNGAGFDMTYAHKLFGAFQRLHTTAEFPGTGIGLAIVQRVFHRHGGGVWAEARLNEGATFFFTLGTSAPP